MRILSFRHEPVAALAYRNAKPGGGGSFIDRIQVHEATVDTLPEALDAIVIASDLQGRELSGPRLVGEALPAWLIAQGLVADPARTLALLAGDLFAAPRAEVRGATGDVRPVWQAFASAFPGVAGVNGNHDLLGEETAEEFGRREAVHVLDGEVRSVCGLRVGGVSGIVGKLSRPNRKDDATFDAMLTEVLLEEPDVVLLHQGPDGDHAGDKGSPKVRATLCALENTPLVVFGHCHWDRAFIEWESRQLLNVDARVVVLRAA